jgi:hypothetical protein
LGKWGGRERERERDIGSIVDDDDDDESYYIYEV